MLNFAGNDRFVSGVNLSQNGLVRVIEILRVLHFLIVFVASTAVLVLPGGCCQQGIKRFNVLVCVTVLVFLSVVLIGSWTEKKRIG